MKKTALIFFFSIFSVTAAFSLDMAAISDSEASQTDSTYNLGNYYFSIGKYADAAKYLETAIYDVEKFGELYENILNMLSECYIKTNDQDGITRTFARVEEYNQHELQKDCADPECLREHAEYYMLTGDNAKAKENYFTLLAMPLTDEEKVDVYVSYAKFLGETDNYASGAEYFHLAANARKTTDGVDDVYIQIVYSAAQYNFIGKQPEKAIDDFKEVLVYYSQMDNCETLEQVANCHSGIGNSLSALAKYDEAKEEYQLAVAYYQKYDQQNDDYPKAIVNLADVENNSGQYEAAIAHYREAMDIYQQRGMADELGNVSNLLNLCYAKAGMEMENDEEIQNAAKNARNEKMDFIINDELANLELNRTYLGEYIYANSLATIAGAYDEKEDFDNAVIYYRHYVDAIRNAVRDEFRMMSENERMLLWNTQKDNINDLIEMPLMLPDEKNYLLPELSSIIYDAVLLSKGILLNSSIEFGKVLYETGDKHLQDVYKQTLQNGAAIDDMRKTQAYVAVEHTKG
ncbi:MAG: tetratricopeptide repeat protein [Prevotella sp.]|nr:tetratricopeptide repeat protein [Prevotella sp.]